MNQLFVYDKFKHFSENRGDGYRTVIGRVGAIVFFGDGLAIVFFGDGLTIASPQTSGTVFEEYNRRYKRVHTGEDSGTQSLRTTSGIPLGPLVFRTSSDQSSARTSLSPMQISRIVVSQVGRVGGCKPRSSIRELNNAKR